MPRELVDLTLVVHRDEPSDAAILVSETGDEGLAVWLPRSKIEIEEETGRHKFWSIHVVTMPVWLAEEKGLV